jgi:SAM-dependent methyltransferase
VSTQPPLSESELCPPSLLAAQEAAYARDCARLRERARLSPAACPACGRDEPAPGFSKDGFDWATCPGCATLYMTPRPSPDDLAEHYAGSEAYRLWAEEIFPASEAARREKVQRPRLVRLLELCDEHGVTPGTLVEIGPGFGTFSALARKGFDRVIAVEPTPGLAAACRERGVETVELGVEQAVGALPAADVVAGFEVIEHLHDPAGVVAACRDLLRPGGLLLLTCPNAQGFDIATLGAASLAVDPEHLNLFSPGGLAGLVERSGLEVLEVATPGRLDAEFVREAALRGDLDLSGQPLLRRVLIDEWERLGEPFQRFLADAGLSSHMWLVARRGR